VGVTVYPMFSFWIMIMLIMAGVMVLLPLARAIGRNLEKRLESGGGSEGSGGGADIIPILRRIEERMDAIEAQQQRVQEHQEFLDALLEKREPPKMVEPGLGDLAEPGPDDLADPSSGDEG